MSTMQVYRRSELEAIGQGCLKRYHDLWRAGIDDASDPALVGIGGHSVKFHYIQRLVRKQLHADAEEANAAFIEGIAAAQTPARLIPELKAEWDYHAERFELELDKFVTAEEKAITGSVSWTPDLIYAHPERNELEIIDDKWGWHPPLTEAELKVLFQGRVYTLNAHHRWPNFQTYRFTICAVRFHKYTSVVFTPSDLDSVSTELEAAIRTVELAESRNHWPAVAGPACAWCNLSCPIADQDLTMPKRIQDLVHAQQLGGWILAAEQMLKAAKKVEKAYVSSHGPVSVNGVEFANRPVIEKRYPINHVLEVLKARGIFGAWDEAEAQDLTISHSSLARLFKAYPALEDDLAGVVAQKTSYRFSHRKEGDVVDGEEA